MKVSDYIAEFLAQNEIDKVFSYIGKNAHLCDSIDKHEAIENVFTIHEQGAGFAADAYARVTNKTGVATATSGPGGTNLVTAIADCYFDSIPAMFIIGDVPPDECKGNRDIRQFGFQETDIVAISKPITKYVVSISNLDSLRYELEKAHFLSQEGRKGPVLISLPENLQFKTDFIPENKKSFFNSEEYKKILSNSNNSSIEKEITEAAELINSSSRPVILIGGGVRLSDSIEELNILLKKTNIPIVYSLMGKDAISSEYKYNLGFVGNFGTRYANFTVANSDVLIVLGSRLDTHQTGRNIETFAQKAKIIQVDIDQNELGTRMDIDLLIKSDIRRFLQALSIQEMKVHIEPWQQQVLTYKDKYPIEYDINNVPKIGSQIISRMSEYLNDDDIICVDVGEHQMLVAQSLNTKSKQRVLFSGAFGSMGFALPAAIGATLGTGKRAVVISGDGGFQMNIQELEIIKRRNLPIKIFIINNACLQMVKLRQDIYLESNFIGTQKDYSVPSFKKVGEAYGIKSREVQGIEKINEEIKRSLKNNFCEIVDIHLEEEMITVEPRLDFTKAFANMRPHLAQDEYEEMMIIKKEEE